jgi:hypothetical protein
MQAAFANPAAEFGDGRGTVHFYTIAGLSVGSDIALPGLHAAGRERRRPDVQIRRDAVPPALRNAEALGPNWQVAGRQFLLRVPEIARFLLTDGREIAFEAEPAADPRDVPLFLLGSAFGILLHQRRQIVLHASAVRVNDKAVLFCGPSGAGKSTLAAALAQRGYPVMTDDFCAVTVTPAGAPMVHPDGRHLKLWAQTIERLGLNGRSGARVRSRLEKFYVDPGLIEADALPLGALYALRQAPLPEVAAIERPTAVEAVPILRRVAYRPRLVSRMGQRVDYFHAATAVANHAGIFYLSRAIDFAAMPRLIAQLERHWGDIGVAKQAA